MIYYHFTNDMRFKGIKENLVAVAGHLKNGNWEHPNQTLAQAKNGWYPVYAFYFGLYKGAHNVDLILTGKWNYVLGEFIKKLQFPNPKKDKQNYYEKEVENKQLIAPLRTLVKLLFYSYEFKDNAGITKDEFKNHILGSDSTAIEGMSIGELYDLMKEIAPTVDFYATNVNVSGGDLNRFASQLLGAIEPLDYIELDSDTIRLSFKDISPEDKAILFDIITYDGFWTAPDTADHSELEESYKEYMQSSEVVDWSDGDIEEVGTDAFDFVDRLEVGTNTLLYGVPGSGKSYTIEHEYMEKDAPRERLVFHPDYTYSDFVGQILPVINKDKNGSKNLSYKFTPGPFTTILKDAYTNPTVEHFLIIEEINRGNAPAIFGEIFQLLDRKTEKKKNDDGYPLQTSEYEISNTDIARFVYGNPRHKVRIPANLSIIGTMNTSDQNVFTLDTAFQRRWDMRLIENEFRADDSELANSKILDTSVTWKTFCTSINNIILDKNVRMTSSEDKRLGTHFVHVTDLKFMEGDSPKANRNNRRFPEKVLKYLWDDAFKFSREDIFEIGKYNSLEAVIRQFMVSKKDNRFTIFKENIINSLIPGGIIIESEDAESAD